MYDDDDDNDSNNNNNTSCCDNTKERFPNPRAHGRTIILQDPSDICDGGSALDHGPFISPVVCTVVVVFTRPAGTSVSVRNTP
jgi:hypothetical protein